jgi:hypothetical protein
MTNTNSDNLINKKVTIPEVKTRHFDNSIDYVTLKKTKQGYIKVLKPEVVEEIKKRLEEE